MFPSSGKPLGPGGNGGRSAVLSPSTFFRKYAMERAATSDKRSVAVAIVSEWAKETAVSSYTGHSTRGKVRSPKVSETAFWVSS